MEKKKVECQKCRYRAPDGAPYKCDYASIMYPETRKAQPIEECTYGKRGRRIRCLGDDAMESARAVMSPLPPNEYTRRAKEIEHG